MSIVANQFQSQCLQLLVVTAITTVTFSIKSKELECIDICPSLSVCYERTAES